MKHLILSQKYLGQIILVFSYMLDLDSNIYSNQISPSKNKNKKSQKNSQINAKV